MKSAKHYLWFSVWLLLVANIASDHQVIDLKSQTLQCYDSIGNITDKIAELWRQHYCSLFNCIQNVLYNVGDYQVNDPIVITSCEVDQAISKLPQNKAGLDNISAEHLKYGSKRIAPLLAVCFTGFLIHSVLSDSMLSVLLVLVIKNKAGMVGNLYNYRPIALATILSKVLGKSCWIG